jgi:hypothetical protein
MSAVARSTATYAAIEAAARPEIWVTRRTVRYLAAAR